jgi:signal transduction histidine kinase
VACGRHRLDVRFDCSGEARSVGPESALALFRVLQEAITNVARHCGKGTAVEVSLAFAPGRATLRIQDRGPGFVLPGDCAGLAREGHYGLANMRERARKVSGDLRMTAAPGRGTCIDLTVHAGEELLP